MRKTILALFGFVSVFALAAFAQDAVPVVTNDAFLQEFLVAIGGIKGATGVGIAFIVVKLLMAFVGTPWADSLLKNNGQWKLTIYLILSALATVISVVVAGGTWGAAFISAAAISAFGVLFNQLYKQFVVKKD